MAIYMKLGNIKGTAEHTQYPQWIALESLNWGLEVQVLTTVGNSGNRLSAGKITPSDVHLLKKFDTASVELMKLVFAGSVTPTATIAVTQQGTNNAPAYLEYTLSEVIISHFQVSASDKGVPMDNISLNFAKVEVKANPTDKGNNPQQSVGGYDFAKALAS